MNDSVVIDLQREALDKKVAITDLLRKALIVATKLKIEEFKDWVNRELNGYDDNKDVPEYRWIHGSVKVWNPYHGWQPVIFPNSETQELFAKRTCGQTIAEVENIVQTNTAGYSLQMPYSPDSQEILRKASHSDQQFTLDFPHQQCVRILDRVRTIVLNWAMKLEEEGILGRGLSFSDKEKKTAEKSSYNITNFYGAVTNSQIQQQTSASIQASVSKELDLGVVKELLGVLREQLDREDLKEAARAELRSEVKTIEAQTESPQPKSAIIRESLASARRILESVAASSAGQLITRISSVLLGTD